MFLIYNLFYINFLQVFSMKFSVNLSSRNLVYIFRTTMEIRVTRPFIVFFIPGDQYGGPDCFMGKYTHLVSFGYSERIYELYGYNFFYVVLWEKR